ncbi:MAG: 50S ribosomal protein L23 [Candidatus Fermentibacter sp.]|nr:50S ribosomal protein L23 [Candidatus Fermentibacter sp.]
MMDARHVILTPLVTEKSTQQREARNSYSFRVPRTVTKHDIARAVEEVFGVSVLAVHTMNMQGKKKRMGRNLGRRSSWKKAIVTLAEGQSVEFFEGV